MVPRAPCPVLSFVSFGGLLLGGGTDPSSSCCGSLSTQSRGVFTDIRPRDLTVKTDARGSGLGARGTHRRSLAQPREVVGHG